MLHIRIIISALQLREQVLDITFMLDWVLAFQWLHQKATFLMQESNEDM